MLCWTGWIYYGWPPNNFSIRGLSCVAIWFVLVPADYSWRQTWQFQYRTEDSCGKHLVMHQSATNQKATQVISQGCWRDTQERIHHQSGKLSSFSRPECNAASVYTAPVWKMWNKTDQRTEMISPSWCSLQGSATLLLLLPALSCSTVQLEAVKGHSLSDTRATLDWRRCQLIFPFF